MESKRLTSRQWMLYSFIKEMTEKGGCSVCDIALAIPTYKVKVTESNFTNCPEIYKDIDEINASYEIEKIIVKDNNNFRLGTEDDVVKYAARILSRALKQLDKYHTVSRKMSHEGQQKLISLHGDLIDDESKARKYVEAYFIKEPNQKLEELFEDEE